MSGGSHELLITHTHTHAAPFPCLEDPMSGIHTYNPILVSRGSSAVNLNKLLIICTLVIFTQSGNTPTMIVCYVSHRGTKGKRENAPASFVLSSWRNEIAAHIICILEAVCGCRCVPFASTRPNNVCKFLVCNFNTCLHASM